MKKLLLLIVLLFSFSFFSFNVKATDEELTEDTNSQETEEEETLTFEEEQIKNAILEILGEEDKKGFIEKNLDVLLASFGGTVVALAVLLYFVLKATGKTKDLVDKFTKQGKLTGEQANKINELIESCEKLIEIGKKEMKQSLETAGASQEEIKHFEEKIEHIMNTIESKEDQIAEILKIALINDATLIKKGVSSVIKEKYEDYGKEAKN